ncbi:putative esterase/lipase [Mycobacterium phage PP]|uniref:Putative esterase/lipase n=1 Tax=Mycobacterium phage PP TaxID=2077134 RepID=A0A2Z5XVJ3_9CAUD|nr:esterase/lipase [Mycobacterium phage PP]BBC53857.1 putative esterase/lipase [Mycobacterium phage PP]
MTIKESAILLDNGFRVGVSQVGEGVPLVFLHGLSVSSRAYEELLYALAARGFAVTAIDAPNHGRSDSLPWGHSVSDMANVVAHAVGKLDFAQPPVIVGHSMGGAIAAEVAAMYPWMVSGLVLLDAAVGPTFHESIQVGPKRTLVVRAAEKLGGAVRDVAADGYRALRGRSASENLSLFQTLRQGLSSLRFIRAARALVEYDSADSLKSIPGHGIPAVVIHGQLDQIVPLQAGREAANAVQGHIFIMAGAYHSWMLAAPELGAQVIRVGIHVATER